MKIDLSASTTVRMISNRIDFKKNNPILIAGFPGPGLLGTICTNYMIDKLNLSHIACVDSDFIYPGVVYVDGKIRHPFRIYANRKGSICILVCEAPIILEGIRSVLQTAMVWALNNSISEVLVMDGIPVHGTIISTRIPMIVGNSEYETQSLTGNKYNKSRINFPTLLKRSHKTYTTYIGGVAGGILSACLSLQIRCAAILVPTLKGTPDPEGAIKMIETVNEIIDDDDLKIDIKELMEQTQKLKKQLKQMIKDTQEKENEIRSNSRKLRMYG